MSKRRARVRTHSKREPSPPSRPAPISAWGKRLIDRYHVVAVPCLLAALALAFHFVYAGLEGVDRFFYMGEALQLREAGITATDFPWLTQSALRLHSASLWYGFSALLVPFTVLGSVAGMKVAGAALTSVAFISFWWAARKLELRPPILWVLLFWFIAPNLWHLMMIRPQTLSLGFAPVLFVFLVLENPLGAFLASFGITWCHLNFIWFPSLILCCTTLAQLVAEKKLALRSSLAVILGTASGWILRPNPIGALRLLRVQLIEESLVRNRHIPLRFSVENFPLPPSVVFGNFGVLLAVCAMAIIILALRMGPLRSLPPKRRFVLVGSAILAITFFLLSVLVAGRLYCFWAEFGVLSFAAAVNFLLLRRHAQVAVRLVAALVIVMVVYTNYAIFGTSSWKAAYARPDALQSVAEWLKGNSKAGDVVFNLTWSDFSPLFFWNRKNYYVAGLDPIFQYSYSPELYWEYHFLASGEAVRRTCDHPPCTEGTKDVADVLVQDFNARYILFNKKTYAALDNFMRNDQLHFARVFDDGAEVIFLVHQ